MGETSDGLGFTFVKADSSVQPITAERFKKITGAVKGEISAVKKDLTKLYHNVGGSTRKYSKAGTPLATDTWLLTLVHEMGHQIHYAAGTPHPGFMKQGPKGMVFTPLKHVPSKYGKTNQYEYFAETFTQYTLTPNALKKASPEAYKWVDQIVKKALTGKWSGRGAGGTVDATITPTSKAPIGKTPTKAKPKSTGSTKVPDKTPSTMTLIQLKAAAKAAGLKGYSTMSKVDLTRLVQTATASQPIKTTDTKAPTAKPTSVEPASVTLARIKLLTAQNAATPKAISAEARRLTEPFKNAPISKVRTAATLSGKTSAKTINNANRDELIKIIETNQVANLKKTTTATVKRLEKALAKTLDPNAAPKKKGDLRRWDDPTFMAEAKAVVAEPITQKIGGRNVPVSSTVRGGGNGQLTTEVRRRYDDALWSKPNSKNPFAYKTKAEWLAAKDLVGEWTADYYASIRAIQLLQAQKAGKTLNSADLRALAVHKSAASTSGSATGKVARDANKLEDFVRRAPKYNGEIYRGLSLRDNSMISKIIESYKRGDASLTLESWSSNKTHSMKFAKGEATGGARNGFKHQLIIKQNNKFGAPIDSLSGFNEWEVLQPRGVRYKVVSTKTKKLKNGQTLTEIEVAPLPNQTAAVPKGGAVTPKASTSKAKTPTKADPKSTGSTKAPDKAPSTMTIIQLKAAAKAAGLKGYSTKSKADLVKMVEGTTQPTTKATATPKPKATPKDTLKKAAADKAAADKAALAKAAAVKKSALAKAAAEKIAKGKTSNKPPTEAEDAKRIKSARTKVDSEKQKLNAAREATGRAQSDIDWRGKGIKNYENFPESYERKNWTAENYKDNLAKVKDARKIIKRDAAKVEAARKAFDKAEDALLDAHLTRNKNQMTPEQVKAAVFTETITDNFGNKTTMFRLPLEKVYATNKQNGGPDLVKTPQELFERTDLIHHKDGIFKPFYRGVGVDSQGGNGYVEQWLGKGKAGQTHFPGSGLYGNGSYAATPQTSNWEHVWKAASEAQTYTTGGGGGLRDLDAISTPERLTMFGIKKSAKILNLHDYDYVTQREGDWNERSFVRAAQRRLKTKADNVGELAAALGYDGMVAMTSTGDYDQDFWVVFNRKATVALDGNVSKHFPRDTHHRDSKGRPNEDGGIPGVKVTKQMIEEVTGVKSKPLDITDTSKVLDAAKDGGYGNYADYYAAAALDLPPNANRSEISAAMLKDPKRVELMKDTLNKQAKQIKKENGNPDTAEFLGDLAEAVEQMLWDALP